MRDHSSRLRWRDQRDSLVARRHRRRHRRRHITRPGEYKPVHADAGSASRGVHSRLLGALAASLMTLVCLVVTYSTSLATFGGTFALSLGLSSFGAAIALILSARHEEQVHALATKLERDLHPPSDANSTDPQSATAQLPAGRSPSADQLDTTPHRSPQHTTTPTSTSHTPSSHPHGTDGHP